MWSERLPYARAIERVKAARQVAAPNTGFICQLLEWDKLRGEAILARRRSRDESEEGSTDGLSAGAEWATDTQTRRGCALRSVELVGKSGDCLRAPASRAVVPPSRF
jgi:hypothetical protein